jgi:hypothetical protein
MDVSFWGPSGWELLHLITFTIGGLKEKKEMFDTLDDILPCKYCRQSAEEFLKEEPPANNLAVWLYDFHEKVNNKLHTQHLTDPKVPEPTGSPKFETVLKKYRNLLKTRGINYPGKDFLLAVAYNFQQSSGIGRPDWGPKLNEKAHKQFWESLLKVYPYYEGRKKLFMPDFKHYFRDVHQMFSDMGYKKSLEETFKDVSKHKSSCKAGGAKTCRRPKRGLTG